MRLIGYALLTLLFTAANAQAACNANRCLGKVYLMYINDLGTQISMNQDMAPLNCSLAGGTYLTLRKEHPQYEILNKLLLSGHLAQNPYITVRVADYSNGCDIQYVASQIGKPYTPPKSGNTQQPTQPPPEPPICTKGKPDLPGCL